jgi:hypothetical protein
VRALWLVVTLSGGGVWRVWLTDDINATLVGRVQFEDSFLHQLGAEHQQRSTGGKRGANHQSTRWNKGRHEKEGRESSCADDGCIGLVKHGWTDPYNSRATAKMVDVFPVPDHKRKRENESERGQRMS